MGLVTLISPDGKAKVYAELGSNGEAAYMAKGYVHEAKYVPAPKPKPKPVSKKVSNNDSN